MPVTDTNMIIHISIFLINDKNGKEYDHYFEHIQRNLSNVWTEISTLD